MEPVKNVLLDLGGVLLDIDFGATQNAFAKLGIDHFHEFFTQHHANQLFEKLEVGEISPEEFYKLFREETESNRNDQQIRDAWNAMLLNYHKERMDWLDALSNKYAVYLFSNTNKIHYDFFSKRCLDQIGRPLESYFKKAWFSHEVHFRKPYPQSFEILLKNEGLKPEETLFIDDTIGNILGAQKAGLQTIHLMAPKTVLDLEF